MKIGQRLADFLIKSGMTMAKRYHPSGEPPEWMTKMFGPRSASGVDVTDQSALTLVAVYDAIRILSETLASLPLIVYKRLEKQGKERDLAHPLYHLLHDSPNPEITAFQFFEASMAWIGLRGNAYAEIERNPDGSVKHLWPIPSPYVCPERDPKTKQLRYYVTLPSGQPLVLFQDEMLHVPGFSLNGIVGLSPIAYARETIGLALAAQEFGARLFSNGAAPSGVIKHPGKFKNKEVLDRMKQQIEEHHRGLSNKHRMLFLEEGMDWKQTAIAPEDAQFLQTRKFQVTEIARLYRIPPHMLGDLERSSFSNIEHQGIDFVVHTMRPWFVRWEQAIQRSLFFADEADTHFAQFLADGLLRGDTATRFQAYATGIQNSWLSPDEVRGLENMNPRPDGKGGEYLTPANMSPSSAPKPAAAAPKEGEPVEEEGAQE